MTPGGLTMSVLAVIFIGIALVFILPPNYDAHFCCHDFIKERHGIFKHQSFSSKSGYSFKAKIKDQSSINDKCLATKIYLVSRHGTRMPGKSHIKKFIKIFSKVSSLEDSNSKLINDLKKWKNPFSIRTEGQLTDTGMKEQYCLAERYRTMFPNLFSKHYSQDDYHFSSTFKERCVQSALSFAYGLFYGSGPLLGYQPIGLQVDPQTNELLRFFDNCDLYHEISVKNETLNAFIDTYLSSTSMKKVRKEVQKTLDPSYDSWNVSVNEVLDMYQICAMETAIFGHSSWCKLFSESSLPVLEYYFDLKAYWIKGPGKDLNWKMSCPLIEDIINSFSVSLHNTSKAILRFAHAETLVPLSCALGLYNDSKELRPGKFNAKRKFRVSNIAPFTGNIALVLYKCQEKDDVEYFVRILSNETPVTFNHPLCREEDGKERRRDLCPLDKLSKILSTVTSCSLQKMCSIKEL